MKKYFSLVLFAHTVFALPFALVGYLLALDKAQVDIRSLLLVLVCMVTARNAAMSFNRIVDRNIDKANERTAKREIPAGKIKLFAALTFCVVNVLLFIVATYFINTLCFYLSFVALSVILGYSYTKRVTWLCHWVLGLGLSLAPIGAYLTVVPSFDLLPLLFSFTVLFWVGGFDVLYALQDQDFDKKQGLRSVPQKFGTRKAVLISRLSHFFSVAFLCSTLYFYSGNVLYVLTVLSFVFFVFYQHFVFSKYGLAKINRAFFTANGIASCLFLLLFIVQSLLFD